MLKITPQPVVTIHKNGVISAKIEPEHLHYDDDPATQRSIRENTNLPLALFRRIALQQPIFVPTPGTIPGVHVVLDVSDIKEPEDAMTLGHTIARLNSHIRLNRNHSITLVGASEEVMRELRETGKAQWVRHVPTVEQAVEQPLVVSSRAG